MRVECSHCRELIEIAGLSAVTGGLGFRCDRCGAASLLAPVVSAPPLSAPPAAPLTPPLPQGLTPCPKCSYLQSETAESCHRCGLVFAKVRSGEARLATPPVVSPALRGRWELIRDRLDDADAHHAFIELCALQGGLDFAGHCYRTLTPPGQAEDPRVAGYRERVLRQAVARVQMLIAPRAPEEDRRRMRKLIAGLGIAFIVLLFSVGYWLLAQAGAHR